MAHATCERLFDCREGAPEGKLHARDRIKALLSSSAPSDNQLDLAAEARCVSPVPKRTKASLPASASSAHPVSTGPPRGCPRLCDEKGRLSLPLTTKIEGQLEGHKYLEANKLDLLICLLKIYTSACIEHVPEQSHRKEIIDLVSQGLCLNEKKKLSSEEERLLGQLAVVGFRGSKVTDVLTLRNFPRTMPIQIAKLPHLRKHGQGDQTKRLFKARMERGKRWIQHLPEACHADLISTMFLDVDKVKATKAIKQSQQMCLRLGPHESASLKSYVGLSYKQYVKLNRMLFYLTELSLLAPIKSVRNLKVDRMKEKYKTMSSRVVGMTRVTNKGGSPISRKNTCRGRDHAFIRVHNELIFLAARERQPRSL